VRFFMAASRRLRIIAIPAFLGILVGGLYLASKYGAGTYWIPAALAATLLIILIGALVTGIRAARLGKVLSSEQAEKSIAATSANTKDHALLISYGLRVGLAIGIVFLMTAKPELSLSMVALGAGALTGLFVARAIRRIADNGKRWEQSGRATHPRAQSS
jgi:ABC-type thiamin/hydroxymethylpyrimidine transport system permease subunit